MQSRLVSIIIGVVLILGTGSLVYLNKKPMILATPSGITLAQIAKHDSRESCWSAINGNVYNLTSWIPNHPGGEKRILSLCGIDGSSKYNGAHGDSSKPAKTLFGFKIGTLAK